MLAGGSGTLRTGEIAPHLRFVKTGPESSRIELANAGQLTVNRGLVFTMSLGSLLDLRRPAVHCTRRPALLAIREAVEELAPPSSVPNGEYLGPEPMREAEAIVRGIHAIAARSPAAIS